MKHQVRPYLPDLRFQPVFVENVADVKGRLVPDMGRGVRFVANCPMHGHALAHQEFGERRPQEPADAGNEASWP